jgi:hypothetical protein
MDDDRFPDLSLLIGMRVCLKCSNEETGTVSKEYGYILHAWRDQELEAIDCYVAFFGDELPAPGNKAKVKPYVLRYLLSSLEEYA